VGIYVLNFAHIHIYIYIYIYIYIFPNTIEALAEMEGLLLRSYIKYL
jgi:hypothetical protein